MHVRVLWVASLKRDDDVVYLLTRTVRHGRFAVIEQRSQLDDVIVLPYLCAVDQSVKDVTHLSREHVTIKRVLYL